MRELAKSMMSFLPKGFRHWSYSRKKRIGNPIKFPMPGDVSIKLYPQGQIVELLYTSHFERNEIGLVMDYLTPGMRVVDIGANIGLYSILVGLIVGSRGKVFAFEPSTESYEHLVANLALNQITCVDTIKTALADTPNDNLFLKRDAGYRDGDRYLALRKKENIRVSAIFGDIGDSEAVSVTTLDRYFYIVKKEKSRVDFLKIDVEGAELAVLRGAKRLLTENVNIMLMFECTAQGCLCAGHSQSDVFQFLEELGFNLYAWNSKCAAWEVDQKYLSRVGNVWACRNKKLLPYFNPTLRK